MPLKAKIRKIPGIMAQAPQAQQNCAAKPLSSNTIALMGGYHE
jgi:hypothetical protein